MGNSASSLEDFKDLIKGGPDLRVNRSILMFSSLSSTESLKQHYEKRRMEAGDCVPDWVKSLAEKLAAFSSSPELAGLGALAVAVLIDIMSFSPPEESVKEALRSVFAEEKSSKVWDLIDECLKRYRMNINDQGELKEDIRRIEKQLSLALTELKNSIVRDGHATLQALKVWVNGTAFHIQMLIHLVRLEGTQNCGPIEILIQDYKRDLSAVFEKHRKVIREECKTYAITDTVGSREFYIVIESEHYTTEDRDIDKYFEVYYNERYEKQRCEIERHFTELERNLPELVCQTGSLRVR